MIIWVRVQEFCVRIKERQSKTDHAIVPGEQQPYNKEIRGWKIDMKSKNEKQAGKTTEALAFAHVRSLLIKI